jgi:hypothetical protein
VQGGGIFEWRGAARRERERERRRAAFSLRARVSALGPINDLMSDASFEEEASANANGYSRTLVWVQLSGQCEITV